MVLIKYIPVKKSQINYYKKFSLYYKTADNEYKLYKHEEMSLTDKRINEGRYPQLFIYHQDRAAVIKELQKGFNKELKKNIDSGNVVEVKETLCDLVEETLSEPRSGTLQALPETVDILVSGYISNPDVLNTLASISFRDYTTVIHSVNVMALTIGFCFYSNFSERGTKEFGLSALLHDVGKTQIPVGILRSERKLTNEEFRIMKTHTTIGEEIIKKSAIDNSISLGAFEHHEKLDGSG